MVGWAKEVLDFLINLKPFTTVDEYQTGLYFWRGKAFEIRIPEKKLIERWKDREKSGHGKTIKIRGKDKFPNLEYILKLEEDANVKYKETEVIPEGWHKRRGKLEHPERYSKNLPYGIYFHLPEVFDILRVVTLPSTEVVKELKSISILVGAEGHSEMYTKFKNKVKKGQTNKDVAEEYNLEDKIKNTKSSGDKVVSLVIDALVRYVIEDGYKAFTKVQNHDDTYLSQTLIALASCARGTNLADWADRDFVEYIELLSKNYLNGPSTRDKWGIWAEKIGIKTTAPHTVTKNIQEITAPGDGINLNVSNY